MKARSALAVTLLCVSVLGGVPARAGSASGVCLATITFTFASPITNSSSPTVLSDVYGTGICETTAQPGVEKTVLISGGGPAGLITRCGVLQVNAAYIIQFFSSPAPSANNGTFSFYGTAAGGEIVMTGTVPQLAIVGTMVGTGAVACVNGGTKTLSFEALLPFVDP